MWKTSKETDNTHYKRVKGPSFYNLNGCGTHSTQAKRQQPNNTRRAPKPVGTVVRVIKLGVREENK